MVIVSLSGVVVSNIYSKKKVNNEEYITFTFLASNGYHEHEVEMYFQCLQYGDEAKRLLNANIGKSTKLNITGRLYLEKYYKNDKKRKVNRVDILAWEFS